MESITETTTLIKRAYWLIKLRWIAIVSVAIGIYFASNLLAVTLQDLALYSIVILLILHNATVWLLLDYLTKKKRKIRGLSIKTLVHSQISVDLIILTFLLHFSGGIENPFSFYFIFHIIIASILLSMRESYLQATFAVLLFGLLILLEYLQFIPHYCLRGFTEHCSYQSKLYLFGTYFSFATTIYIVVYMASYIATKLKEAEEAHREANILLCQKDRIKDEYILRVTHGIKGDLAAIQSCHDVVANKLVGPLNEEQEDFIKSADDRTKKITRFVRSLLKLTQMRLSDNFVKTTFSLQNTINNAVTAVETKAKNKAIELNCSIESSINNISGNQLSIEEVVTGILRNAVKYTPPNGTINIKAKSEDNYVLIEIYDTGIGIPEEELPNIFDEFYRATNAKKVEKDGSGLGLAIAKQIIEKHSGKIWVESKINSGTRVYFTLPTIPDNSNSDD
jgi:signal transduction histidine kinase